MDVSQGVESSSKKSWSVSLTFSFILIIIYLIGMWKVFVKAGKPGWTALIPIYNNIIELEIVGKPCWWALLYFVPIANIIVYAIVMCILGDCFNKSSLFKIGLIFLPFIFLIILGFDDSKYTVPIDIEY